MKNDFTIDEIKNSVEYQWRKHEIKSSWILWLVIACFAFSIPIILIIINFDLGLFVIGIVAWLCLIGSLGLAFLFLSLYYYRKMRYLLKNYQRFTSYEVVLDKPSSSFVYKSSIYYTVTVNDEGFPKKVDTNPYFSSFLTSKFTFEDFNNKKVVGLYDDEMDIFYIVKRVG
ncbi:MAG: hypothetical protein J1F36_04815 [Clostridiales bacterium]|nr:hypothetical protein [Clostridiales bacterium]